MERERVYMGDQYTECTEHRNMQTLFQFIKLTINNAP